MDKQHQTNKIPVVEGWFTKDSEAPALIGNRCRSCGDYFFPKADACRNPDCMKEDMKEVMLSRRGRLWSYTNNYYQPPAPYVPPTPFVPYALAVVELLEEKLMVMGQLADGYDFDILRADLEMELVVEPLYTDKSGNEHIIWKWKPVSTNQNKSEK